MKANAKVKITRLLVSLLALLLVAFPARTPALAGDTVGTIAYIKRGGANGDAIRLIEPDGSGDRLLYQTNHNIQGTPLIDIYDLAWKPDASELAFSSRLEIGCSLFETDIYTIRPDGTNYRRVTDPPACAQRAGLPKGTVVVPVVNNSMDWVGPFFIYVEGAPGVKDVALGYGQKMDVVFTDVADYGDNYQQTAIFFTNEHRGTSEGARVDVIPGQTVRTGLLVMGGSLTKIGGFLWPTYLPDGSRMATIYAEHTLVTYDTNGPAVKDSGDWMNYDFNLWGSALFWAPIPELSDYFLYLSGFHDGSYDTVGDSIFLGNTDGSAYELLAMDGGDKGWSLMGLAWLPDGSGFLYSWKKAYMDWDTLIYYKVSNIYEYSFETGESTQLTNVANNTYIRKLTISPDGSTILYEYQTGVTDYSNGQIDLYMMNRDGSDSTLFVESAQYPVWSSQDIPEMNPAPVLNSINPAQTSAGGATFTLTASGSSFSTNSVVRLNGANLTTTYENSTTLRAQVPADKITAAGTASVTVYTPEPGGGVSGAKTFTISAVVNNPVPTPTSLTPTTKVIGQGAFTLTVTGSNFVSGSVIRWNGTALVTTFVNSTTLTTQVPADKTAAPGNVEIKVFNPTPGGGVSQPLTLVITSSALKPTVYLPFVRR